MPEPYRDYNPKPKPSPKVFFWHIGTFSYNTPPTGRPFDYSRFSGAKSPLGASTAQLRNAVRPSATLIFQLAPRRACHSFPAEPFLRNVARTNHAANAFSCPLRRSPRVPFSSLGLRPLDRGARRNAAASNTHLSFLPLSLLAQRCDRSKPSDHSTQNLNVSANMELPSVMRKNLFGHFGCNEPMVILEVLRPVFC